MTSPPTATPSLPWHQLREGAAQLGLPLPEALLPSLQRYAELLEKWGAALRLTGSREPADWVETHFLDSLTPLPELTGVETLLDIGSGAGFPGLPLALALPHLQVTLLETYGKKATFLRTAAHALGLSHAPSPRVTIRNARAEDQPEARFDAVISRALCAPEAWLPLAAPWTRSGGRILAMLGREQPSELTLRALGERHGCSLASLRAFTLPRSGAHRAVVRWDRLPIPPMA